MNNIDDRVIFVVDDDVTVLDSIKLILEGEGFIVQTAEDGEGLRKKLEKQTPHLIILDYRLPGQNGTEIAKTLKRNDETKDIPIVMVSSHDVGALAKSTGISDFFEKPFDIETLISVVGKHLPN